MPGIGSFHTFYFAVSDTSAPVVHVSGGASYPAWQASVITSTLPFGPLGGWLDAMLGKVRWWRELLRMVWALTPQKRQDVKAYAERSLAGLPHPVITKTVDRVVQIDRYVNRPIDRPIETIVEKIVEKPVDKPVHLDGAPLTATEARILALDPERRAVLDRSLDALESPAYAVAQQAVRTTATTLGFNRPEAWKDYNREIKSDPGRMENVYRHLRACHLLRDAAGSTLTNPDQNLLVELAYHGFAQKGR